MKCPHNKNNYCQISTDLAMVPVDIAIDACTVCSNLKENPQSINSVTLSKAIWTIKVINPELAQNLRETLKDNTRSYLNRGPGTELKKLISWFIWKREVDNCTSCYNREIRMNLWGPDECRRNITTIIEWLRESAAKHSIPFSETLVKIIINKAIRNSEKHYEVVRSSNNSPT